jgi:hypothetical protein
MKTQGLQQSKISKQKVKLLCKKGGEINDAMLGSMIKKMRQGGNAVRYVSNADGSTKKQAYKMGGWVYSGSSKK